MHSFRLRSHVGPDGILNLQVPSGVKDAEVEVTVTVKALSLTSQANQSEQRGWPPGFFEQTLAVFQISNVFLKVNCRNGRYLNDCDRSFPQFDP